jgi:hypothetical protein
MRNEVAILVVLWCVVVFLGLACHPPTKTNAEPARADDDTSPSDDDDDDDDSSPGDDDDDDSVMAGVTLYGIHSWEYQQEPHMPVFDYAAVLTYSNGAWAGPQWDNCQLYGIGGVDNTDICAVGIHVDAADDTLPSGAFVARYSGGRWSIQTTPPDVVTIELDSVSGASPTDIYVIGWSSNMTESIYYMILHNDGTSWRLVKAGTDGTWLNSVWAAGDDQAFAVGGYSDATGDGLLFVQNDGAGEWRETRIAAPQNSNLAGVWGASATDVYAVGSRSTNNKNSSDAVIFHYDGRKWRELNWSSAANGWFLKVTGASGSDIYLTGHVGNANWLDVLRYDGNVWRSTAFPNEANLKDIFVAPGNSVFASADVGLLHYDGASWRIISEAPSPEALWGFVAN